MFDNLKEKSLGYRPIPFWSWNDKLDPEELRRQIRWMNDNGMGGFFMHAREGLRTEYLSEEWMECIDACCDEAKKLGMDAWGYDENGYPSGFVGGKLLEIEENCDMYILYKIGEFDKDATVSYRLDTEKLIRVNDKVDGVEEYLNLYLKRSANSVDILNPDVVRQFIDETHEVYKAHFGGTFPATFKGFFTDEPQYYRYDTPYTPMVKAYFEKEFGGDIWDEIGLLFVEKEGYRKFRYHYWKAMQHLMLEAFGKQIYDWCDENGVELTGHYVEEISMGWQIMCCGGIMPFYEYEHIPGVDWLGSFTDNELGPKQVSSLTAQMGKKQTLTECFGCCGWDITPGQLRRVAGFLYANGVNLMCQHLVPYTESGAKKRDHPAHFSPVNPWVKENFKDFNDYFTRLGFILGEGKEPVNVAMIHPIRSAYFDYKRETEDTGFDITPLEVELRNACRELSKRGISYHFLDETLMEKHGFVDGDKIGCGQCEYEYLVLPAMYTMGVKMEEYLRTYIANGGKVLLLGETPSYLEGEPFVYSYLTSNCTIGEIEMAQPYRVANTQTELYGTYREFEGKKILFLQNASVDKSYTQEFLFTDGTKSFVAFDPITFETKKLPLTITLKEEESIILVLSEEEVAMKEMVSENALYFKDAEVSFDTNFMTVDMARYSKDGVTFSEPILCRKLFYHLLEERYTGDLYLEYDFEVRKLPEQIALLAEKKPADEIMINGHSFVFTESCEDEPALYKADITAYVKEGKNTYRIKTDWYQNENVYRAMFGEGVTHALMNCIVYDNDVEAIYLAGKFGVYSDKEYVELGREVLLGHDFYIGEVPTRVSELTTDGFTFFRGEITLKQKLTPQQCEGLLKIEGRYTMAEVKVNDKDAGVLYFGKRVDVSPYVTDDDNEIEVTFWIGNRNMLGPFHCDHPETYMSPGIFALCNLPNAEDGSVQYRLHRFYKK